MTKLCPKCQNKLVNIVYGFPASDLFEQEEREEIYLGGCMPSGAKYHCFKCDTDFYWNLTEATNDPQPINLEHIAVEDKDNTVDIIKVRASNKTKWLWYNIFMNKINLLLTQANDNLKDCKATIEKAVEEAEQYAFPKLKIDWDIDLLVTNRLYDILIPEDGVGGRTRTSDFIEFAINDEKATKNLISEMIAHELCHAARWGKSDEWINFLFDGLIFEGIATYFEAEFIKNRQEKSIFIKDILKRTDSENKNILKILRSHLDSNNYDYDTIFFYGNKELPRWAGYSLGYYLVKKYLEKTGKSIEDAFADKYANFRMVLK